MTQLNQNTTSLQEILAAVNNLPEAGGGGGGSVTLIDFTIAGIAYQAEEGMTWAEWVISSYNTGGFALQYDGVGNYTITQGMSTSSVCVGVKPVQNATTTAIIAGQSYRIR